MGRVKFHCLKKLAASKSLSSSSNVCCPSCFISITRHLTALTQSLDWGEEWSDCSISFMWLYCWLEHFVRQELLSGSTMQWTSVCAPVYYCRIAAQAKSTAEEDKEAGKGVEGSSRWACNYSQLIKFVQLCGMPMTRGRQEASHLKTSWLRCSQVTSTVRRDEINIHKPFLR